MQRSASVALYSGRKTTLTAVRKNVPNPARRGLVALPPVGGLGLNDIIVFQAPLVERVRLAREQRRADRVVLKESGGVQRSLGRSTKPLHVVHRPDPPEKGLIPRARDAVATAKSAYTLSPSVEAAARAPPWSSQVQFLISGMSSP